MAITVPQSRLILKTVMANLRNNLAFANLVDWEPHSTEMNDRNGFVVSEQVGPRYQITETSGAVADLTGGVQDTVFGSQTFTLNRVFGMSMGASDLELITDLGTARKSKALSNGIADMASKIDYHVATAAAQAFPWSTGTWGTTLINPDEVAAARARLAEASLESDTGISTVVTHQDRRGLSKYIFNDNASLASEGSRAMRNGFSGMIDGIPVKATNQLGRITTGTRTAGTVAGASQNVNYSEVSDSGSNAGYYLTQTFLVAGIGAGGTVKAGEIFTITTGAAVDSWDPNIDASRGFAQQFVVLEDAVADTAGAAALRIFPAIVVGDGTTVTGAGGVNNAHRTVTAAPDNGATVTFLGTASTTYIPRVMFKKDAIVVHSAQLILPYTGQGFRRSLADAERDNVAPLMPRLWLYSDPNTGAHRARIDVFVQAQARDRWAGVKYFGA
jgi:hypothetical protein